MFLYLSFLRPPPLEASLSGAISITPQISNDLRTEPFDGPEDIYFSWLPVTAPPTAVSLAALTATNPKKLTTWRQSNAYKEITVPAPPNNKAGLSWRLSLSTGSSNLWIDLEDRAMGPSALPVISMPIKFSSRSKRSRKQENIERVYCFPIAGNEAKSVLTLREQTSFDLDKKIWDSGIGLSSWLVRVAEDRSSSPALTIIHDAIFSCERRNILELGSGTGLVALVLCALRSAVRFSKDDTIITTDLREIFLRARTGYLMTPLKASALPLLEHNISENTHLFSFAHPIAEILDWDDLELPANIVSLGRYDAIVMADVTYNTASFPSLVRTMSNLIKLGDEPPVFLLGYKKRDPAERTLWTMASAIGITFELIGETRGTGGAPVEIWAGFVRI